MKALFIGLGGIGQRHLRNLHSILGDEVQFLAYRTRRLTHVITPQLNIDTDDNIETKYQIAVFTDLDEALAQQPDLTFVCNPSSLHIEVALQAARAGSHVFIEKPLAHSLAGVDELANLLDKKRLIGLVAYQLRFHPAIKLIQRWLHENAIGRILAVRADVGEWLPGFHKYEDYRQMYASRRDLGGGVVLSQIHEFDYLYAFFGLPRRVFALGGHLSSLEIDVEDVASILMECHHNGQHFPVHLQQDYMQRPPQRTCQIVGDTGKILLDLHTLSVIRYDAAGQIAEQVDYTGFERNQMFLDEMLHFLACVRGEAMPLVNVRVGAQSLKIALAVLQSLTDGQVVNLYD